MSKAQKLADFLYRRGFGTLGTGKFSVVMAQGKSDRCVKICLGFDDSDGDASADRWCEYMLWAQANGYAGTFAPKLYSLHCFEDGLYTAVIERLWKTVSVVHGKEREEYNTASQGLQSPFFKAYPGARGDFYRALRKEFPCYLDLRNENWMIRRNGDLVLTDPIASQGSRYSMRLRSRDLGSDAILAHIAKWREMDRLENYF